MKVTLGDEQSMAFDWNPITVINAMLCAVILILGCWGYQKGKAKMPLAVGIAFGIFGVSHIMAILGLQQSLTSFLIIIRVFAYLIVVLALYHEIVKE